MLVSRQPARNSRREQNLPISLLSPVLSPAELSNFLPRSKMIYSWREVTPASLAVSKGHSRLLCKGAYHVSYIDLEYLSLDTQLLAHEPDQSPLALLSLDGQIRSVCLHDLANLRRFSHFIQTPARLLGLDTHMPIR